MKGHVCYYAPDALQWEDLEFGHAEFVRWALTGGLASFAGDLRWEGWESQAPEVPLDEVVRIVRGMITHMYVDHRRAGDRRGCAPARTGRRATRASRGGRSGDGPSERGPVGLTR